ncbi:MAG: hypothetical protein K2I89_08260, partial [Muribaculaceae bacterium]|nr:hypothetical protein [Muribaculaceae bacterium]
TTTVWKLRTLKRRMHQFSQLKPKQQKNNNDYQSNDIFQQASIPQSLPADFYIFATNKKTNT